MSLPTHAGVIPSTDAQTDLALVSRLAAQAAAALADEREGDFTAAVEALGAKADALRLLVRTW